MKCYKTRMIEFFLEEMCQLSIRDWEGGVEIVAKDNQGKTHTISDLIITKEECLELSLFFEKMANDRR